MQKNEPTMEKGIHYIENVFEYNDLLDRKSTRLNSSH